jgi:hypothetical protein
MNLDEALEEAEELIDVKFTSGKTIKYERMGFIIKGLIKYEEGPLLKTLEIINKTQAVNVIQCLYAHQARTLERLFKSKKVECVQYSIYVITAPFAHIYKKVNVKRYAYDTNWVLSKEKLETQVTNALNSEKKLRFADVIQDQLLKE